MTAALVAEYRKLVSTRMWWLLLVLMAAYVAFIGAVFAFSLAADQPGGGGPALRGAEAATSVYSLLNAIGYVFPLVIGTLVVTGEFRHKTVTQSLLVEPRRGVFLAAKLGICVPLGLLYGVVSTLAVVAGAAPVLSWRGDGAFLGDAEVLRVLALGALVIMIWTLVGAAFGTFVTNQVAAVVVVLAFTQFVEPIARISLGAVDALAGVSTFLPGAAADAVIGDSFFATMGSVDLLPPWAGALLLLAYAAAFALLGRFVTLRRDIS